MKRIFSLLALTFVFALAVFADVRFDTPTPKAEKTPKQVKSISTTLSIRLKKDAKEAKLLIPKSHIKQLRAELALLDGKTDATDAPIASTAFTRTQTIVSGLFLSAAFVLGGVWFARSRKAKIETNKSTAIGAFLFLSGALATVAFANIGPPIESRNITGKLFAEPVHQFKQASGKIKVEISDAPDAVELVVPDGDSAKGEE